MFKIFDSPSFDPEIDAKDFADTSFTEISFYKLLKRGFAKKEI